MMEKFNVTCSGGVSVINLSPRPFNSNTECWEWPGAEAEFCSSNFLKRITALHNYEQQSIHLHAWGPNTYQEHSYTQVDTLIFSVSKFWSQLFHQVIHIYYAHDIEIGNQLMMIDEKSFIFD